MGKDPRLARYVAERVVLRTEDVRQPFRMAKHHDIQEEMKSFRMGPGSSVPPKIDASVSC